MDAISSCGKCRSVLAQRHLLHRVAVQQPPLTRAVCHRDANAALAALEASPYPFGPFVDVYGNTALHIAAYYGHLDMIHLLLHHAAFGGCNLIDHGNRSGATPLMLAAGNNQLACVIMLLRCGASIDATDARGNNMAHVCALRNALGVLRWLVDQRVLPGRIPSWMQRLLHLPKHNPSRQSIVLLLHKRNRARYSPLQLAVGKGHLDIARYLVQQHGVSIAGALPVAALRGHVRLIRWLRSLTGASGADAASTTGAGWQHYHPVAATTCPHALPAEVLIDPLIRSLCARGAQLTALPSALASLTRLQTLILSRNRLKRLPPCIGQLRQLRDLRVSHNQLRVLPASLLHCPDLVKVIVDHNPLVDAAETQRLAVPDALTVARSAVLPLKDLALHASPQHGHGRLPADVMEFFRLPAFVCDHCRRPGLSTPVWVVGFADNFAQTQLVPLLYRFHPACFRQHCALYSSIGRVVSTRPDA